MLSVFLLLSSSLLAQNTSEIKLTNTDGKTTAVSFPFTESAENWDVFKKGSKTSLIGKRVSSNNVITFTPLIPFQTGVTYSIAHYGKSMFEFTVTQAQNSKPEVVTIYPTSDTLPSNLLKFYLEFSEPMAEGNPYPFIHLVENETDTLGQAFLQQLPALWNANRTMLTLWLDPGRIKRDLNLNKLRGNPLDKNKRYQLIVEHGLKSRSGIELKSGISKTFSTIEPDRIKPSEEDWHITNPESGSKDTLVLNFSENMDFGSTSGRISILHKDNQIAGEGFWGSDESSWSFKPIQPWEPGVYELKIDSRIEDLAGNNLNRLFDRDISKDETGDKPYYSLSFTVE